jgi:hypothetical protein
MDNLTQKALDWVMQFYPFCDGLDPPLDIRVELEASLQRNKEFLSGKSHHG